MPKVKCPWDVCKHFDWETGCCDGPDVIELASAEVETKDDGLIDCLVCNNFEEVE